MIKVHACISPVTFKHLSRTYPQGKVINHLPDLNDEQLAKARDCFNEVISRQAIEEITWWAHPLSEKNEHGFGAVLFKRWCRVLQYMLVIKAFKDEDIILIDEEDVVRLLQEQDGEGKWCCINHDTRLILLTQFKDVVVNSLRILWWGWCLLISMFYARLKYRVKPLKINPQQPIYILRTWLDGRLKAKQVFKDSYFGDLSSYLLKKNYQVIVVAGIVNQEAKVLANLSTIKSPATSIVPEFYFSRCSDIIAVIGQWLKGKSKFKLTKQLWMGVAVGDDCARILINSKYLPLLLTNLIKVFIYQRMANQIKPTTLALTFENYAWEKMVSFAFKKSLPSVGIVGFQHAFISANSFKYFSSAQELALMPKPDRLVTLGETTRDILLRKSGWNKEAVMVGCALRQPGILNKPSSKGQISRVILVPLTMVAQETHQTLSLINAVDWLALGYRVILRPHPATDGSRILNQLGIKLAQGITVSAQVNLDDDLMNTSILCYTSSTVVLEALSVGIPCVYLNVLKPLQVNPILTPCPLAFIASTSNELINHIKHIESIKPEEYHLKAQQAKHYAMSYFQPVNEKNMDVFCL